MAYKDEEEKRRKAQERKAAGEQYQQKREELLKKNAELNAAKPAQAAKNLTGGTSRTSATAASVNASAAGYAKRNNGDSDMAKVVASYNKEQPDIAQMTYDEALGFATRIVYDNERDDFLSRWQKAEKKKNGSAPTMDEMRAKLNSQKPGGLYRESKDAYAKQTQERFKQEYDAATSRAAQEREENGGVKGAINKGKEIASGAKAAVSEWLAGAGKGGAVWNTQGEAYTIEDGKATPVSEEKPERTVSTVEWQGAKQKTPPSLADAMQDEKFMQAFIEKKTAEAQESGGPVPGWQGPQQKSLMQRALEDGEYQAFVKEQMRAETAAPQEAPEQVQEERPVGTVDLKNNPVSAFMYSRRGDGDLLTRETQDAINALVSSSPAAQAIAGLDAQGSMDLYAQAAEQKDPYLLAKANQASRNYLTGGYVSVLGSTLSRYVDMARGERWPDELRDDMEGVVLQVALAAEDAHERGEFTYDPDKETLYDAYLKANPQAEDPLRAAQSAVVEMELRRQEMERLAADEAAKAEQELLRQHQSEVRSGNPSQEAYEHVLMEAPQVTAKSAMEDETYRALLTEIRTDRTLADGMEDSWHNQMATRYLRENGKPVDLKSVDAMLYKDALAAFEEDVLLSDMRVAKALGYESLGAMYEKWGGMDADKLHGRAETAMREMAESVTSEDVAAIEAASVYQGTGEGIGYGTVIGKGLEHGVYATAADMLEAVWAFDTIALEDRPSAAAQARYEYVQKYDLALAAAMYKRDMLIYAENAPSKEQGDAIRAYLESGSDPFALGINPTQTDIVMEAANAADARAEAVSSWAQKNLNQKKGRVFEVSSATSGTLLMQGVATIGSYATGSGLIGSFLGYGLVSSAEEMREQLTSGAMRKDAALMGFAHGVSDTLANMSTSEKFSQKVKGFFGYDAMVNLGRKNVGDAAAMKTALGMVKEYGWAFLKSAGEQALEETVKDPLLEEIGWQAIGAGTQAMLNGANVIAATVQGLSNIDVVESVEKAVRDAGANFISTLPLAVLAGLGDGFKASRAYAGKLASTGAADDAKAFVRAFTEDLKDAANRDALNSAMHDAAVAQEATVVLMTDEEVAPIVDSAAKAQEQADAHAESEKNSMAAAEAGRAAALAAQERMNAGEVNPELVTQVANGVSAHAKNSQSTIEHRREKEQKQLEADKAFSEGIKKAAAKAEAQVDAREAAAQQSVQDTLNDLSVIGADLNLYQNMRDTGFANRREDFEIALDSWDGKETGLEFVVAQVSEPLKSLGVADAEIVLLSDKLAKIKEDHPAMTNDVIRQLPEVLENPVVIMKSRRIAGRLTMFGNVADAQGAPVLAVVSVDPKRNVISEANFIRLNSAYGKTQNPQGFIDRSEILYVDKKRAADWAVSTGLQLPVDRASESNSSTNIVAQTDKNVNPGREVQANIPASASSRETQRADYTGMDNQRIAPTRETGRARTNPVRIFKRLASDLNVGQALGTRKMNGLENRAAGYYQRGTRYIATGTNWASSVEVAAHEIGHAIADRLGITGTDEMVANLTDRFTGNYTPDQLPGEAFAEFFWRYMVSDEAGRAFAGDAFVAAFERAMRQNGMYRSVHRARREIRRYLNAEANERIGLMIRDKSDKRRDRTAAEWFNDAQRRFVTAMVDSTRPAEDVNQAIREATGENHIQERMNLRNAALMQSTAPRRAWNLLTGNLTDVRGTIIGESLRTRFKRAGINGRDFDLLNEYMLAKHSLDRDRQGRPVFDRQSITQADTQAFIEATERDHPEIRAAAEEFQKFRHDFMMAYMVDTGYMQESDLTLMEQMYPNYVPTYRVKDRGGRGAEGQNYQIRRATGSTEEIVNPMDSFVEMVNTIVAMNLRNETAKTWDRVYREYEGMAIFGREVDEDVRRQIMSMRQTQAQVRDILNEGGAGEDMIQRVLDAIGEEQTRTIHTGDVNLPNVLSVQLPSGDVRFYEMFDTELFDMIAGTQDSGQSIFGWLTHLTRGMSMLTTGSNPVFALRNFMRDYQNSVNYGSWAGTYMTGLGRWLSSAYEVWRESGDYEQYRALGGGGWTQASPNSRKGADEYRGELFEGYNTSNIGRTAKWAGRKVWEAVTLERVNEVIEQASRYAEYKYGRHDRSTPEGRQEAYLAAQDVTTDFSRRGASRMAQEMKALVPFFNASLQGTYRLGRQATEAERGRAGTRFIKTVLNTGVASALASLSMLAFLDEEDQEEFFWLSDDMKAKHMYLPNFAPDTLGDAPLIRIPLSQDPLSYAVHAAVTNAMWTGEGEDWAIGICAIADNLMNSVNPIASTSLDPLIAMSTNKNWYGSNIVPRSMEGWYPTTQYTEETPEMFKAASQAIDAVGPAVSPMMLQYIAEQYTGYIGQMAIPYFSKNKFTGEIMGLSAVIDDVQKTLTSDPLISSGIVSTVYDNTEFLTYVTKAGSKDREMDMLRPGLTEREKEAAYEEAYDLTHSGGTLYEAKKAINNGYAEIEEIEGNPDLTDDQKYELTSEVRREMIQTALYANEVMEDFRQRYVTRTDFASRWMHSLVNK